MTSDNAAATPLEIIEPENCGNAPRAQVIRDLAVAVQSKDAEHLAQWLADDVQWEIVGFQRLSGLTEVLKWVTNARDNTQLRINSILTHGREGSVDGRVTNVQNISVAFCYMIRFTSTAKTAKIAQVRSYLVSRPI
ncbi:nuclear transport factor 2 family protein [Glutamicibacter creatinolyticus]|uniref:nuclear transport factor 2 family protein n=1 Tax=Glutamicibacter creatinolyticus TaxID=162496 RepID=UPI0037BF76DE